MKEKYGFVYIWRDKKHNRYYIGCHWGTEDDGYVSSSPWLMRAYKRRSTDFKRRILQRTTSRQDTFLAEQKWLQLIKDDELKVRYYNLNKHVADYWHQYEDKRLTVSEKISAGVKARRETPDGKANYLAGIEKKRGRKQSPSVVSKRAAGLKQALAIKFPIEQRKRQHSPKGSEEHLKKLSEASKRRWQRSDAKAKQAEKTRLAHIGKQHRLGHINTPEHIEKIRRANTGKRRTPEQRQRASDIKKGKSMPVGFKEQQSIRIKQMWDKRKQGILPMPNYGKVN